MNAPLRRLGLAGLLVPLASSCAFIVHATDETPPPKRAPTLHMKDEGALGPYSASVQAGELVFVSGKIGKLGEGFASEAHTAIDAVEAELRSVGLSLKDVVSATVYLTDMGRYADFNSVYAARFAEPYPARACVAVAALPAGAAVEIQVVARRR